MTPKERARIANLEQQIATLRDEKRMLVGAVKTATAQALDVVRAFEMWRDRALKAEARLPEAPRVIL